MNIHGKHARLTLPIVLVLAVLAGCQKDAGPAESAGKALDKAMESAGHQVEKAGQAMKDAAKGARK
jgi:predicted small secreted protein